MRKSALVNGRASCPDALHGHSGRIIDNDDLGDLCRRQRLALCDLTPPEQTPRRVLIAWNGSKESAAALSAAIPLLQRATNVTIAAFKRRGDAEPSNLGPTDLIAFLGHHSIKATPLIREHGDDTGEALLSLATEIDSDLLVMGCYGHSQFRELCLGGASRTILHCATLPVLMTH